MPRTQFAMPVLALAVLIPHAAMAVDATPDASQVVAAIEGAFGVTPGERRNHIKGTCAAGEFVGTKEAAKLSRSPLFSGQPVPVIARFSLSGGNPQAPDVLPGEGVCNIPGVLAELKKQGFKGLLSIEYEEDPSHNMKAVKQHVKYYDEQLKLLK